MDGKLKGILSKAEQARLAENGITLLPDDVLELVSGGSGDDQSVKGKSSTVTYQSYQGPVCCSMESYKDY